MGEGKRNIDYYRRRIDEVDNDLVELIEARFTVAEEIGKLKKAQHLTFDNFERNRAFVTGMEPYLASIFKRIFFSSDQIQYHGRNGNHCIRDEHKDIPSYQEMVEEIDEGIFELLEVRFIVSEEIGKLKTELGLPYRDFDREKKVTAGMSPESANLYGHIFFKSSQLQYWGKNGDVTL